VQEWEALTERIGFWLDMEHPYITYDNDYIESVWWIVKQLWDKGLLYLDYRSTPHCPRCGTSLSDGEVALGYREDTPDPSVYVKFRLTAQEADDALRLAEGVPTYVLAWTTTPWTLPGNTALAVQRYADYALLELEREGRRERLILADALRPALEELLGEDYQRLEVLASFPGEALVGLRYQPLYDPTAWGVPAMWFDPAQGGRLITAEKGQAVEAAYTVIAGEFVSLNDGTGVVHIAPAFGGEDFDAGKELGLLFLQPVDLRGQMIGGPWAGQFVKDADGPIMDELAERGLLLRRDVIRHTYPFCWRCDTPLLYYAKPTWYIRTTAVKDSLIEGNERINWYPGHIRHGRFGDWLNNNVDWALSRERYWGTPLPVWQCDTCGAHACVGSREEMWTKALDPAAVDALDDLHRPYVDRIELRCDPDGQGCGGTARRLPEVMDCWLDSGAMPYAQWHYPFENRETFGRGFPADFICEAVDQTRGWFYTLHAEAVLLHAAGAAPENLCYRNVICLGHIQDDKGRKMSKSLGNVVEPMEVLDRHGADALRWYLYTATRPGEARRFSADLVAESLRRFLLTLWNTYSFFVTYANIDRFDPKTAPRGQPSELDRWLLSELHTLVRRVTEQLEEYDPTGAGRAIQSFVEDLSNWYVRRSRRRFWKTENDADKLAAYHTLYGCLVTLCKLMAPFTPFVAEEMYQNLVRSADSEAPESVHLAEWPEADESQVDQRLMGSMRLAMRYSSLVRNARSKAGIKVRQPLAQQYLLVRNEHERQGVEVVIPLIEAETNAKHTIVTTNQADLQKSDITIQDDAGYAVGLDTKITPELAEEGLARELVHRIQNLRKAAGFDISDHITTYLVGPGWLSRVLVRHGDYVRQETLSEELVEGAPPDGAHAEEQTLESEPLVLAVLRRR
jgi:isoleucyl-tRNA synthetase